MQQDCTILLEGNAISEGGIRWMYFDAFSSKSSDRKISINTYEQGHSIVFWCCFFTGKERDEETDFGYFGARYMDHEMMTMWLSVDPLADKYHSISPYAYCAWNPVKLVDPDGREVGVYYTRDGKWVGRDKWNDNKVYICDGKDDKGNFLNAQDLKITHSAFRKKTATVYGESSAYRYSGNTIPDDLKYEMYAIASVLERNGKAYGGNSQKAKDFLSKTPEKNNRNNFRV